MAVRLASKTTMKDGSHLSDSQALILLKSHEPLPVPADRYERWVFAIPMFLFFLVVGGTSYAIELYGGSATHWDVNSSFATTAVLEWHAVMVDYPWIFPAGMFIMTWLHFAVLCRRREYAKWIGRLMALVVFVTFFIAMLGILLPVTRFKLLG